MDCSSFSSSSVNDKLRCAAVLWRDIAKSISSKLLVQTVPAQLNALNLLGVYPKVMLIDVQPAGALSREIHFAYRYASVQLAPSFIMEYGRIEVGGVAQLCQDPNRYSMERTLNDIDDTKSSLLLRQVNNIFLPILSHHAGTPMIDGKFCPRKIQQICRHL